MKRRFCIVLFTLQTVAFALFLDHSACHTQTASAIQSKRASIRHHDRSPGVGSLLSQGQSVGTFFPDSVGTMDDKPAGAATGERIGNAISAAVNTAFPAVGKILDAIWPKRNAEPDKKVKAADAEADLKKTRDEALNKQKGNFDEIKRIADELATVRMFMASCIEADRKVVSIQSQLGEKTTLTDQDKKDLGYLWTEADGRLQELKSPEMIAKIDSMQDPYVQLALRAVRDTNLGLIKNIATQISSGDCSALRRSLNELEPKLSGVNAVAGQLIGNISAALKTLPDKIGGSLGSDSPDGRAKKDNDVFERAFSETYTIKKQ